MKRSIILAVAFLIMTATAMAQLPKVYDESIDPMAQIDEAVAKARAEDKFVVCQVGGNWCRWCLMFADFIKNDDAVAKMIDENFVFIHVNYPTTDTPDALLKRLDNPGRFGYPVLVVLDDEGKVIHIQDSSFLEEGQGYNPKKVLRFFKNWTPKAVKGEVAR